MILVLWNFKTNNKKWLLRNKKFLKRYKENVFVFKYFNVFILSYLFAMCL